MASKRKKGKDDPELEGLDNLDIESLDDEVREALADDKDARRGLSEEIAQKWDPNNLLRLVSARAGKGERLDESTRRRYEQRLGVDLGDVRVYTGDFADEVTKAHSAEAITVGGTGMILMGSTAARSNATSSGRALLAHELTHVAQDLRGVHRSTYDGERPLATEQHEQEAESEEARELEETTGAKRDPDRNAKKAELIEKLFTRLVEVFEEEERMSAMRNGS